MTGETWQSAVFLGKQTSQQLAVPATRRSYVMEPSLTVDRPVTLREYMTGTRDARRSAKSGRRAVGGSVKVSASGSELLEWLEMTFGPPAISTPSGATTARRHVYTPGSGTPTPATMEYHDGARAWQGIGTWCDTCSLDGSAVGENQFTFGLFALDRQPLGVMAAGLTERVPTDYYGWESRIFLDAYNGGTPGTTEVVDAAIAWNFAFGNQLGRKAFANNSREYQKLTTGRITLNGGLRLEGSDAAALAEYLNWDADTPRLMRIELGNNVVLDAGTNEVQTLTITGTPTGGTYTLSFNPGSGVQTTGAIPYNATAAQVLTYLLSLPAFVYGDLAVAGGPHPGTAITVTFQGRYSGMNVAQMTATGSFTGGSSPAIAVSTTTPGVAGFKELVWIDIPLIYTNTDITGEGEGTREYQYPFEYLYDPSLAAGIKVTCQTGRTAAFS